MNNTTWYRLKVGGFKNKEEATHMRQNKKITKFEHSFCG